MNNFLRSIKSKLANNETIRHTISTSFAFGIRFGLKALVFLIIARILGADDFGKYAAISAFTLIFQPFSSWGSGNLMVKYVTIDRAEFPRYWGASLFLTLTSGLLLICIANLLFSIFLPTGISKLVFLFFSIGDILLSRVIDVTCMAFLAVSNYKLMNLIQIISSGALLFPVILILILPPDNLLLFWGVLYTLSLLLTSIFAVFLVIRKIGKPAHNIRFIRSKLSEGLLFSLGVSAQNSYNDIDKLFLANLSGFSVSGAYSVAYKIINLFVIPINAVLYSTYPRFFKRGQEGVQKTFQFAKRLIFGTGVYSTVSILIIFLIASFLPKLLGATYSSVPEILILLSPLILLKGIHGFLADTLTGSNFQGSRTIVQIIVCIINLVSNFLLIPLYSWRGAIYASLISDSALVVLFFIVIKRKGRVPGIA
jgi:O-antigen/teichoic acid export membrane protein